MSCCLPSSYLFHCTRQGLGSSIPPGSLLIDSERIFPNMPVKKLAFPLQIRGPSHNLHALVCLNT